MTGRWPQSLFRNPVTRSTECVFVRVLLSDLSCLRVVRGTGHPSCVRRTPGHPRRPVLLGVREGSTRHYGSEGVEVPVPWLQPWVASRTLDTAESFSEGGSRGERSLQAGGRSWRFPSTGGRLGLARRLLPDTSDTIFRTENSTALLLVGMRRKKS